jgi:hypothetical protein
MQANNQFIRILILLFAIAVPVQGVLGQAASTRGLWVGQVTLSRVNEVTIPLNASNVAVAPDPDVATPTSDAAQFRLILHVNGAGQASLLKDVAVLRRTANNSTAVTSDHDVALVSDERIYGDFPPQPAKRIATAVFDFGDSRASDAVNAVMESAALAAAASVNGSAANFTTTAGRNSAQTAASAAALAAANPVVAGADAADGFRLFLQDHLNATTVDAAAAAADPTNALATVRLAATNLQSASFYGDTRGLELVNALLAAIAGGVSTPVRSATAQNVAASYADTADASQRFLAGVSFGTMITSAAATAATVATNSGATLSGIRAAVESDVHVNDAKTEALQLKIPQYSDTRGSNAIAVVLGAIIQAAFANGTNSGATLSSVQLAAEQAGRDALAASVPRYAVSAQTPTADYNTFIASAEFLACARVAADAAAAGAVSERANSSLYTLASLQGAARAAAINALQSVYSAAARAVRTELPLQGLFGPGLGDPRFTWDIKQTNGVPLGAAALTTTLYLPANHPTNPFRHRRHPDHVTGFDIRRNIRLDFDGSPTNSLEHAGFGVDQITGTYREEIAGLHKPLGPLQTTGLKVEGRFELNRISLIDTLNAR